MKLNYRDFPIVLSKSVHGLPCIELNGAPEELKALVRGILGNNWTDHEDYIRRTAAHAFLQGDSGGWMLIEFWTKNAEAIQAFRSLLVEAWTTLCLGVARNREFEADFSNILPRLSTGQVTIIKTRPSIVCMDNARASVQASARHHCVPKDDIGPYTKVEVFTSVGWTEEDYKLIADYDYGGVYAGVPVELVMEWIRRHGGVSHYYQHGAMHHMT